MVDLYFLLLELSSHFGENKGLMLMVDGGGWKRQLSCVTAETAAAVSATACDQESFNLLLLPNRSFLCRSFLQELKELILPNSVGPVPNMSEMLARFVYNLSKIVVFR